MERAHRKLRAWLADGLSGDNADSFTRTNQLTTTEVATVALGAQAVTCSASERRTGFHFINAEAFDEIDFVFRQCHVVSHHDFASFRMCNIANRRATQNAVTQ